MKAKTPPMADHQLREAVMTQLDWEPEAPAIDIGVSVSEGAVTLTGFQRIKSSSRHSPAADKYRQARLAIIEVIR